MSHVGEPFVHDVFVSYSHGDADGDGESLLKQWSQAFARELEAELRVYPGLGQDLSVFVDQSRRAEDAIDPLAPLTQQLREQVARSATLAVLMSPHYLKSSWCREERDWWASEQPKHGIPTAERVALAWIWPTPLDQSFPTLFVDERKQPLVGYCFYDKTQADSRPQPFEWPQPEPTSKGPFRDRLLDLAGALRRKLDSMRALVEERQRVKDDAAKLVAGPRVVYLHARSEQGKAWEVVSNTLSQNGFAVVPGEPDPVENDPIKQRDLQVKRVDTLQQCDALLLLGAGDGRTLDADLLGVGRMDRNSARARSHRSLPCALIDRVGAPMATAQRIQFARQLQVDWIDGTAEPWVPKLEGWLSTKSASLT